MRSGRTLSVFIINASCFFIIGKYYFPLNLPGWLHLPCALSRAPGWNWEDLAVPYCVSPSSPHSVVGTLHLVSKMWAGRWQRAGEALPWEAPQQQGTRTACPCCRRSTLQPVQSGLSGHAGSERSLQAAAASLPWHALSHPCWKAGLPPRAAAQLLHTSLASSSLAACALAHICSQGSWCPQNIYWASVNLSLLYGKSARNYSLQLPTHTTPCFFTDTYPLTKITIKKPPREMYFWEPVLLTCCHCETYIINRSYAVAGFFLLLHVLSEAASYLRKQVFSKTLIVKLRIAG